MRRLGTLLCLASATAFGAMAAFGKLAYDAGATVGTLLSVRFGLAAVLLWALLARRPRGARAIRAPSPRRDVALALALGGCAYAIQAGCYFAALERIDASLLSLLVYTFPAIVAVAAIALGRERASARRLAALVLASAAWRSSWPAPARARSTRSASRLGLARRAHLRHVHPRQRGHRRAAWRRASSPRSSAPAPRRR